LKTQIEDRVGCHFLKAFKFVEIIMKTKIWTLFYGLIFLFAIIEFAMAQEQPTPRPDAKPPKPFPVFPMDEAGLTPAAEKDALEYIGQSNPKLVKELEQIKRENPASYFTRLKEVLMLTHQLEITVDERRIVDQTEHIRAQAMDLERRRRELELERRIMETRAKEDPARFERESKIRELERQSHELGESYRKAQDEAARKTIRSNIANLTAQLFDLREMNRQEEVKRMEAELKRLKDTLAQRQKNRADIIERRIQQLTGEAGAMEWE
jgi:hypothetical protein